MIRRPSAIADMWCRARIPRIDASIYDKASKCPRVSSGVIVILERTPGVHFGER